MKTHAERQKNYEERQRDAGLRRRAVWVPEAATEDFWAAVEKMRREWIARGLMPEDNE